MELEALQSLVLFERLSHEQLVWLVENSSEIRLGEGEKLFVEGQLADALYCLVEGQWRLSRQIGGAEAVLTTTDYRGSWVGGIPLIGGNYLATARIMKPTRLLKIPNDSLKYMLDNGFPIASHLLAGISTGARNSEAMVRQQEKMAALGKLSAGLAHELNNPAAAARRASVQLRESFAALQTASLQLNRQLAPAQLERVAAFQRQAAVLALTPLTLGSLERSDREDEISAWLEDRGVEDGWEVAPTLVEAGLGIEWLDGLATEIDPEALGDVLGWLNASLSVTQLLNQLEQSADRISTLVKAVKEYSYMDQAPLQNIDVHDGLESTLAMLVYKLKHGITVVREYDRHLPKISAFGSELNQVWTNLLDNAIGAMEGKGQITLRTWRDSDRLVVEIVDNGPGIPADIQNRIFEPFFTTKGVGEGSGLGLDIAYRIVVTRHKGEIKVLSEPGNTRFQVWLPIA